MGYTGGTKRNPTYHWLGDHSEAIEIEYDPKVISYEELLGVFWSSHDPTRGAWSRQYKASLFYHNEEQKRLALESAAAEAQRRGATIKTEILPAGPFYEAEGYHQKYSLQRSTGLMKKLAELYPVESELLHSTAAARLNGYLGGNGDLKSLERDIEDLTVPDKWKLELKELLQDRRRLF